MDCKEDYTVPLGEVSASFKQAYLASVFAWLWLEKSRWKGVKRVRLASVKKDKKVLLLIC